MVEIRVPAVDDLARLEALLDALSAEDVEPLSEYKRMRVGDPAEVCEAVAVDAAGDVVCYAQAAHHPPPAPDERAHWAIETASRAGAAVTSDVVRFLVTRLAANARWVYWSRRDPDEEVAGRLGLRETRALHQLRRTLPLDEAEEDALGVRLRPFRRDHDEEAWIATNNAAFAGHPENGAVTRHDLERRFAEPWFDPEGLLMAWEDGVLVGSCWTKVHPSGEGEIYIIGVHPRARGRGLGRLLVVAGLDHLSHERGASSAMLWSDASNVAALSLYDTLGFTIATTIRQYEPLG